VRGEVYASDRRAREALTEPKLVIEVLSPSPAGHDRGEKFAAYRLLPALEEYGLVDPARKSIEGFRRIANGHWQVVEHGGTEQVVFGSVGVSLDRADLFRDAD
jgi:Uma2 family endonuclease